MSLPTDTRSGFGAQWLAGGLPLSQGRVTDGSNTNQT
jgi:hypothetical protein